MAKCRVELIPGYYSWKSAKCRCNNPNTINYHDYGGRGIKFSPDWNRFADFHADMGDRPEGTELDRIDNDGDYCLENCRWATRSANHQNKRSNVVLTFDGKTLCLAEWAIETGISHDTLAHRLKAGWSTEKTLSTPKRQYQRIRTSHG